MWRINFRMWPGGYATSPTADSSSSMSVSSVSDPGPGIGIRKRCTRMIGVHSAVGSTTVSIAGVVEPE
jgi:hypothetical protein